MIFGVVDFIVAVEDDLGQEEEDGRRSRRPFRPVLAEDDEEDLEAIARRFEARSYGDDDHDEYDEYDEGIVDHVDQQALLPSIRDPKLWMVNCEVCFSYKIYMSTQFVCLSSFLYFFFFFK